MEYKIDELTKNKLFKNKLPLIYNYTQEKQVIKPVS